MKSTPKQTSSEPKDSLGNRCYPMKNASNNLGQELAKLYDEPVSNDDVALMADRLTDFVGLLLEIEAEVQVSA